MMSTNARLGGLAQQTNVQRATRWGKALALAGALAATAGFMSWSGGNGGAGVAGPEASLELWVNAPDYGYVGQPTTVEEGVYSTDGVVHNDVTLAVTLAGSFEPGNLDVYGGPEPWGCAMDAGMPESVVVTCHADTFDGKYGFGLGLTPTAEGSIAIDSVLTEGGVTVTEDHRAVPIIAATDANLGIYSFGGGLALIGQPVDGPFVLFNDGPLAATGVAFDVALAGPGRITGVFGWTGDLGLPIDCIFNDTTASCAAGDLPAYGYDWIDVMFEGTAVGDVSLTGNVAGNEPDPFLDNNTAVAIVTMMEPRYVDLGITMTDAPDPIHFKKPLTYTLVVANNGPDASTGAQVNDWLSESATFVSVTTTQGSCYGDSYGYVSCDLGAMAAGASATITIVVTPREGGTLTNDASVWSWAWEEVDPEPANNYAQTTTTVRGPNPPVVTISSQERFPIQLFAYVPCVDDYVILEGTLHASYHMAYKQNGGWARYAEMFNPQGIRGLALDSGTKYQATGMTRYAESWNGWFPASFHYQNNFRLIGQGPRNDLVVHVLQHVTFGPDGTPVVDIYKTWTDCK